jgi:hypothetical protein
MKMYQDERKLDFHALGREIKRKREAKGWTQEYLVNVNLFCRFSVKNFVGFW